jgi:hypothetical protein
MITKEEQQLKLTRLHELETIILQRMPEWAKLEKLYMDAEDDSEEEDMAWNEFDEIDIEVRDLQQEYHSICSELGLVED